MYFYIFIIFILLLFFIGVLLYNPEHYIDKINNHKTAKYFTGFQEYVSPTQVLESVVIPKKYEGDLTEPTPRDSAGGKNESRCREILEKIYPGMKFPTVRPDWLKNPNTNRNLELDMYCHKLKLACEYDGEQHIRKTKFHRTQKEVVSQFRRDEYKQQRCKDLGITLIRVPHWVKPVEFEYFIRDLLKRAKKL